MKRVIVTGSEEETRALGHSIGENLQPGNVVALSGELGTGKTALVRGICEHFACLRQVTSPTFTIINEYAGSIPIVHCDLYRLERIEEMIAIGLDDAFSDDRLALVEWAERALPLLPVPRLEILCRHTHFETSREFIVSEVRTTKDSVLGVP